MTLRSAGTRLGDPDGTRWWYYASYCVNCEFQLPNTCTTAFAKGGYVFTTSNRSNPEGLPSLDLIKNRWGWAINLATVGRTNYDIWAGAGLNKTANGVLVGTLTVDWNGSTAIITYNLTPPNESGEFHIYASDSSPTTTAPGQYGNIEYFDPRTDTYSKTISVGDTDEDGIWIIAHAVACYPE